MVSQEDRWVNLTAFLAPIFVVFFIFLTGLFSFFGMYFGAPAFISNFPKSFFLALVYGFIAFLGTATLVFAYFKTTKKKRDLSDFDFGRKGYQANKEILSQYLSKQNRKKFYSTAFFVAIFSLAVALIFWKVFGFYPSQAFFIPFLWVFISLWFFLTWMLPSTGVKILLVTMFIMRLAMFYMGSQILLYFLPYLLMFPMFAVMNFLMLFGPLAFINIQQIKTFLPGESKQDEGKEVRGQPQAMKQLEQALLLFDSEEGEELEKIGGKAPRGILMKGPPGVGKTLFAKWAASVLNCPIVTTTGAAYVATFMGIDILVMLYTKMKVNGLAKEWGKAVLFIDEADQLMMRRAGMQGNAPGVSGRAAEFWNLFSYDDFGNTSSSCGLSFINRHTQEIIAARKEAMPQGHPQMFPGMMGGMGSMAIFPYLAWLDGYGEAPLTKRIARNKINQLLDILLVVPPKWRIPALKPETPKVLHLAASNRPQVMDPALLRTGRYGLHVEFRMPDGPAREDIFRFYLGKIKHDPILDDEEKIKEFGRTSAGLSPADIEQILRDAISVRYAHVMRLKFLKKGVEENKTLDEKEAEDWQKYKDVIGTKNWDIIWADWYSIIETLGTKRHGVAQPPKQAPKTRRLIQKNVGYHEIGGHLLTLKAFLSKVEKPTFLSVVPRGESLGLVAHIPIEERDDIIQWMIEGYIRVSVGSLAAERIFLEDHDSGPGVTQDLINATRIAFQMVSVWGMSPRTCKDKKGADRYEEIGESVLSFLGAGEQGFSAAGPFAGLPMFDRKRRNFAIILGQAYVDDWRVIKKNKDIVPSLVDALVEKGELTGNDLENIWGNFNIQPLDENDDTEDNLPEMTSKNRFYSGVADV